jgi:hypothetical protein
MQPTRTLCERDWPNKVNFGDYAHAIKQPKKFIPKEFLKTEKLITIKINFDPNFQTVLTLYLPVRHNFL